MLAVLFGLEKNSDNWHDFIYVNFTIFQIEGELRLILTWGEILFKADILAGTTPTLNLVIHRNNSWYILYNFRYTIISLPILYPWSKQGAFPPVVCCPESLEGNGCRQAL